MAYYLVFAFFPLFMIIHASFSMVLSGFDIENTFLYSLLPDIIDEMLEVYIEHVSKNSNISFLFLGIILTVYTLSRFMKSTKRTIRKIYHSQNYRNPILETTVSVIFSLLIIASFYISLFLLILGGQLMKFIEQNIQSLNIIKIQTLSRFIFTLSIIFAVILLFYLWIPNIKQTLIDFIYGTTFSAFAWIIVSGAFSFYMDNFSNYSLIYGSIGAFIMLLLWIYISCLILLMGAVINAIIYQKRHTF